tara:strand:- start:43 stop:390 length:348 start_codon:yes stop_codon:yes gene_type:complete
MVIKVGKAGSICLYWNDLYISSIAVHDNHQETFNRYKEYYKGSLKDHLYRRNIKDIINFCNLGLNTYRARKMDKQKMDGEDHSAFQMIFFFLLILELVDFDDVVLYTGRKKKCDL